MRRFVVAAWMVVMTGTAAAEPQLVAYGAAGLRVGDRTVFTKPVDQAALDRAQDLLWFVSGGSLEVLDLRDPTAAPVIIAKKMPADGFTVSGVSSAAAVSVPWQLRPVLVFGKKPRFEVGGSGDLWMDAAEVKAQVSAARKETKRIKLVGKKWLKGQLGRAAHAVAEHRAEVRPTVTLPAGTGQCDDDSCGTASSFGDTAYQLVVTGYTCGDSCGVGAWLHDPATGTYAAVGETGGWVAAPTDFGADPTIAWKGDGATYSTGSAVCTLGARQTCTKEEGWSYLGWSATSEPAATPNEEELVLVLDAQGLVERTVDGSWTRTLVDGAIDAATHDPAMDLVWILRGGKLDVLDLRASTPTPVAILTGVPYGMFEVTGVSHAGNVPSDPREMTGAAVLAWKKTPAISAVYGVDTADPDAGQRALEKAVNRATRKVKIVGKKWLKAQLGRAPRALTGVGPSPALEPIPLPDGVGQCEVDGVCGRAIGFGDTGLALVLVRQSWDSGHTECVLHDPAASQFADPLAPTRWSSAADAGAQSCQDAPYRFDRSGKRYLAFGKLCSVSAGCVDLGGSDVGWRVAGARVGHERMP